MILSMAIKDPLWGAFVLGCRDLQLISQEAFSQEQQYKMLLK